MWQVHMYEPRWGNHVAKATTTTDYLTTYIPGSLIQCMYGDSIGNRLLTMHTQ